MGVALELVIIPVVLIVALVVTSVWVDRSVGAILLGILVLTLLLGSVVMLLRFAWAIEDEEGVHEETGESPAVERRRHGDEPATSDEPAISNQQSAG